MEVWTVNMVEGRRNELGDRNMRQHKATHPKTIGVNLVAFGLNMQVIGRSSFIFTPH